MAGGTPAKSLRNRRIVEMRDREKKDGSHVTFRQLAKIMNLSMARTKELYYREKKRMTKGKE